MMNYTQQLQEDGYFVMEGVLSEEGCKALLNDIISSFSQTPPDFILESGFRVHTPLAFMPSVDQTLNQVVAPTYSTLASFLQGQQRLVELSSITVFPHAQAQNLHPDEQNSGKYLISVFVNLAPTTKESGALRIVPGSHNHPGQDFSNATPHVLELPMGSAVFMNSKTWHGGGANQTQDRIRPVFYFSLGEPDLAGPTYSIRPDVYQRGKTLADFRNSHVLKTMEWTKDSRPKIPENTLIVAPLNLDQNPTFLLIHNCIVTKRVTLTAETPWIQQIIALVVQAPGHHTLEDIQRKVGVEIDWLLAFFQYYASEGWFCSDS